MPFNPAQLDQTVWKKTGIMHASSLSCLRRIATLGGVLLLLGIPTGRADVVLPKLFSDGMVLQSQQAVPVWGWTEPHDTVIVHFAGQTCQAVANKDGYWMTQLAPMPPDPIAHTLRVTDSTSTQTVNNVVVGEVWLCVGQSNMNLPLRDTQHAASMQAGATNKLIRFFTVPQRTSLLPRLDVETQWVVADTVTVHNCSAVAYCFARELTDTLGVPVGLLVSAWSGTRIVPWIPPEGLRGTPELAQAARSLNAWYPDTDTGRTAYQAYFRDLQKWINAGQHALAKNKLPRPPPLPPGRPTGPWLALGLEYHPICIFNGMIHPLQPYALRGALWYQGESDAQQGLAYAPLLQALISGWHRTWKQGDFPFYYVQLPAYGPSKRDNPAGGDGWAAIREAQRLALTITNTGMACAIDIGGATPADLHPRNKLDIGKRLALWARAVTYHQEVACSGPLYRSFTFEGGKIRVQFDHVDSGLMAGEKTGLDPGREITNATLKWFAIAGNDKVWHWADAIIDGDTVLVSSAKVATPAAVRYAYTGNPEGANLYNRAGLPTIPFRTDQW